MNRPMLIALGALMTVYIDPAVSELKKYREWPALVKVPTPEIKRQYEFDPEAGAISAKLLSLSYNFSYGSRVASSSFINYTNSAAVSGAEGWNVGVSVYHGFAMIMSFDLATTQKLIYQSQGKWPASALKIYSESMDAKGNLTKTGLTCKQIKSFPASNIFPSLPENLYRYECSTSTGSISNGFTWAPGAHTYETYYSDYLDMPIFTDLKLEPPVIDGITGYSTAIYSFIDKSGNKQKITLPEAEMKNKFLQQ